VQHELSDISKSIGQGNLQDAGHKLGDLLHHLSDLIRTGQISPRRPGNARHSVTELAKLLPQQS
jgi:hypothetical protein